MTFLRILAVVAIVTILGPADVAQAASTQALAAPPAGAAITSVTANGSGCRQGEGVSATWTDASSLKVSYGNLAASAGGDSSPLDFRRNCQLSVQLEIPDGYTVALASSSALLYANVANGATATHSAIAYWAGMSAQNAWSRVQRGPFDDSLVTTWTPDAASLIYASCGYDRPLNINQTVRVARGTSDPEQRSTLEFDTFWGGANARYQLTWKTCD
jgi:hypothetical protein